VNSPTKFYVTISAVEDYMRIARKAHLVDDDDTFCRYEDELRAIVAQAHPVLDEGGRVKLTRAGHERWRGPKPARLGLVVSRQSRPEGPEPQVVAVTSNMDLRADR
jgi:hypothetical protein